MKLMLEAFVKIDGIVCYNDQIALEAVHAIEESKVERILQPKLIIRDSTQMRV